MKPDEEKRTAVMTLRFRSLILGGVFLLSVPPLFIGPFQANTAPAVTISSPANGAEYAPGSLVTYSVSVSDKEDGESKYEEIPATEVFMELRYFSDPAKATAFRKPSKMMPGYALFTKGDCYNCHAVHSKVIGPSFSDIAARYKKPSDPDSLARHIIRGSTGIWGTAVMPTHPDLTQKDALQIVRWILSAGKETNADYFRGAEGAFRLPPSLRPSAKGMLLLKAVYSDHGSDKAGTGSLTGQDVKQLKLPAVK